MQLNLFKTSLWLMIVTISSKVLGLFRDIFVARTLGSGYQADACILALNIPLILRRLFTDGVFNQAVIPILNHNSSNCKKDFDSNVSILIGTFGLFFLITSTLLILLSNVFVILMGIGWFKEYLNNPYSTGGLSYVLASHLIKYTLPYLFFISLAGLACSILNLLGKYYFPAILPMVLNIVILLFLNNYSYLGIEKELAIVIGVFFGGLCQFFLSVAYLYKLNLLKYLKIDFKHPLFRKTCKNLYYASLSNSVIIINVLISSIILSFLKTGSISWFYYSQRLIDFPQSFIGMAFSLLFVPIFSKKFSVLELKDFNKLILQSFKVIQIFGIPAILGLLYIAKPIIILLFYSNEFNKVDVNNTANATYVLLASLIFILFCKNLMVIFAAINKIKATIKIGYLTIFMNIILSLTFSSMFGFLGVCFGLALSSLIQFFLLFNKLKRLKKINVNLEFYLFSLKILIASFIMLLCIDYFVPISSNLFLMTKLKISFAISKILFIGILVYIGSILILKINPYKTLMKMS